MKASLLLATTAPPTGTMKFLSVLWTKASTRPTLWACTGYTYSKGTELWELYLQVRGGEGKGRGGRRGEGEGEGRERGGGERGKGRGRERESEYLLYEMHALR